MYRPGDVSARLGISATTLRRYAVDFEPWLSASARPSVTETGALGARRYTADDLAVLAAVKRAYDASLPTREIQDRLGNGSLPLLDVVDNNPAWALVGPEKPTTVGLGSATVDLPATLGGDLERFLAQMAQVQRLAPALTETLRVAQEERVEAAAAAERQRGELAEVLAEHRAALQEQRDQVDALRAEREALAALRAELAAERADPKVLPGAPTLGARVRRWFTGRG